MPVMVVSRRVGFLMSLTLYLTSTTGIKLPFDSRTEVFFPSVIDSGSARIVSSPSPFLKPKLQIGKDKLQVTPEKILIFPRDDLPSSTKQSILSACGVEGAESDDFGELRTLPSTDGGQIVLLTSRHPERGEEHSLDTMRLGRGGAIASGVVVCVVPYTQLTRRIGGLSSCQQTEVAVSALHGLLDRVTFWTHVPDTHNAAEDSMTQEADNNEKEATSPITAKLFVVVPGFVGSPEEREEVERHVRDFFMSSWDNIVSSHVHLTNDGRTRSWMTTVTHSSANKNGTETESPPKLNIPKLVVDVTIVPAYEEQDGEISEALLWFSERIQVEKKARAQLRLNMGFVMRSLQSEAKLPRRESLIKLLRGAKGDLPSLTSLKGPITVEKMEIVQAADAVKEEVRSIFRSIMVRRTAAVLALQSQAKEEMKNITLTDETADSEVESPQNKTESEMMRRAVLATTAMGLDPDLGPECGKAVEASLSLFDASYNQRIMGDVGEPGNLTGKNAFQSPLDEEYQRTLVEVKMLKRHELLVSMAQDVEEFLTQQVAILQALSLGSFKQRVASLKFVPEIKTLLQQNVDETLKHFDSATSRLDVPSFREVMMDVDAPISGIVREARHDLASAMHELCTLILDHSKLMNEGTDNAEGWGPFRRVMDAVSGGRRFIRSMGLPPISLSMHYLSPNAFGISDVIRDLKSEDYGVGSPARGSGEVMSVADEAKFDGVHDIGNVAGGYEAQKQYAKSLVYPYRK
eukprot:GHVN01041591.1.p1 GENE.GHVN01041591.1~~GHVN01041591.1.p1  ORF type:complete len:747 (+),score=116.87 GHVN01041591.1:810-3050(+)